MKYIPDWQNKLLKCHFCGTTKSVKYTIELHGAICDNKPLEVCVCNKCATTHEQRSDNRDYFTKQLKRFNIRG